MQNYKNKDEYRKVGVKNELNLDVGINTLNANIYNIIDITNND